MGRKTVQMKLRRRRRDLTNQPRVPCNFCDFSSTRYGCSSLEEQDNGAVKEVERLRLLIKRMTGKDDSVSFSELLALESHLKEVRLIVMDQKKKIKLEEDERLRKQKKEADEKDGGTRRGVLVSCKFSTCSSEEETQEKQDYEAPLLKMKREFERRRSESVRSEFERLWLLNERMNGRELDGMTSFDLLLLHLQIQRALSGLRDQKLGPRKEQIARQEKEEQERCSWNNDEDHDISLRFRSPQPTLLTVSRKLRRFQNRHPRRTPCHRSAGVIDLASTGLPP